MDLTQTKLTKSEWASVEVPVDEKELEIIKMILDGYEAPDVCVNTHLSMYEYLKIPPSPEMDAYLFTKYFAKSIAAEMDKEYAKNAAVLSKKQPNKADLIRMQKADQIIETQRSAIFEFVLIDTAKRALNNVQTQAQLSAMYALLSYRKLHVRNLNPHVLRFIDEQVIPKCAPDDPAKIEALVWGARECIEKNGDLIKYSDQTLYSHQRRLFEIFKKRSQRDGPQQQNNRTKKLVLYMAPTGTGKTLSPIGLSNEYRVIFVCVARHVGLALAKSAISAQKRVAFAFGCETADDIRLHYFAAADYTVNKRSGGIYKVDNSNGSRVEIMICDVASYLVAMYYMKSFFSSENIVTYWDEPTISMDYETHDLHKQISRNWRKNQIGQMVLSCATLPKAEEIEPIIRDFQERFAEEDEETGELVRPEIHTIDSYDCKKTIAIQNKNGEITLPHTLFGDNYREIVKCADHCDQNRTLLRYFDVGQVTAFLRAVEQVDQNVCQSIPPELRVKTRFRKMEDVTLLSIKTHYLDVLRNIQTDWPALMLQVDVLLKTNASAIITHTQSLDATLTKAQGDAKLGGGGALKRMASVQMPVQGPATTTNVPIANLCPEKILITTRDAHTLTDGPTIFLTNDVNKIGQFYIQQSRIPESILAKIQETIDKNDVLMKKLRSLEREMAEKTDAGQENKKGQDSRKAEKEPASKELRKLQEQIEQYKEMIQTVRLPAIFVPNTAQHQNIWVNKTVPNAFVPNVDDDDAREIMALSVDNNKKILLMLGIGVFSNETHDVPEYTEIMKRLAYSQSLYLIIASSDYIYGTNYQFCHGFIGKDLVNMTQQKTIQAIGRIGRNAMQQEYTVRFRDDAVLKQLFQKIDQNREAIVMTRLFTEDLYDEE